MAWYSLVWLVYYCPILPYANLCFLFRISWSRAQEFKFARYTFMNVFMNMDHVDNHEHEHEHKMKEH
jgi:hypothetical protein